MNINMDRDEFHTLMMLYLVDYTEEYAGEIASMEEITDFQKFILHIQKRPLDELKRARFRATAKDKMNYRRLGDKLEENVSVRLIV